MLWLTPITNAGSSGRNEFFAVTMLSMLLCAVPFFAADWLPMIDLPQHLGQAHLVGKVLSGEKPGLLINWLSPDTLTTWILTILLTVLSPLIAAKALVLSLVTLSILGIALMTRKIGASVIVVPLSAGLLFNQSFYWGFLPFIAGFAAFLFVMVAWHNLRLDTWRDKFLLAALFLLVYFCHLLWFAFTLLTVLLFALISPERNTKLRAIILAAVPSACLVSYWYPFMRNYWMNAGDMTPFWAVPLSGRLQPEYAAFAISGLKADFNLFLLLVTLSFILGGIGLAAFVKRRLVSIPVLAVALILLVAYLLMPDRYNNTVLFSIRWLPYLLILFLMGCFVPIQSTKWRVGILLFSFMALGVNMSVTAYAWSKMEKEEMSGLMQAIEKLPAQQNVLGLDFIRKSSWINTTYPYCAIAAYVQVFDDGEANFSFADHAASLVIYKTIPARPYKKQLNVFSQEVSRADVNYFNFVLVNSLLNLSPKHVHQN